MMQAQCWFCPHCLNDDHHDSRKCCLELQHRLELAEAVCEEFGEVTIPPEDGLEKVTALIFQKKLEAWQAAAKGEK